MTHKWILDVLTDLKTFAALNGLEELSRQLDVTHRVAGSELEDMSERSILAPGIAAGRGGQQPPTIGTRYRA